MNFRFFPMSVAGLRTILLEGAELAERIPMLKQVYDEQFALAALKTERKHRLVLFLVL